MDHFEEREIKEILVKNEHKLLVKNTFYSYLTSFGNIIFQITISFLLARLISKEDWGFLILATSYISIVTIISNYFPPALEYSLNYYISRDFALNKKAEIKSFIKKALISKLIFLIPLFFISFSIFHFLSELFIITLEKNINVLYILMPLIIIIGLYPVLNGINLSFNLYNLIFFFSLIKYSFQIFILTIFLLFSYNINIVLIALIEILSCFIPFLLNSLILLIKIIKIKTNDTNLISFKEFNKKVYKYGAPISIGYLIYGLWDPIQLQGIGLVSSTINVTGYNISLSYANNSRIVLASLSYPLTTAFTRLNSKNKFEDIKSIYNFIIKFSLFLLLLVAGLLFFFGDFILFLIYGESYLIFSIFLKLMVISTIFRIIFTPFEALILAQNKGKYLVPIKLIMFIVYTSLFFFSLINFGILGAIWSIIISTILIFLFYAYLNIKFLKIKLNLKQILYQYLIFFISMGIAIFLEDLFLKEIKNLILGNLNLLYFQYLPFFSIIIFLTLYFLLNIKLKIFTTKDLENLELILNKKSKIIKKFRRFLDLIGRS